MVWDPWFFFLTFLTSLTSVNLYKIYGSSFQIFAEIPNFLIGPMQRGLDRKIFQFCLLRNSTKVNCEVKLLPHSVWSITTPLSHAIIHERAIKKSRIEWFGLFCLSVCLYYIHFHMSVVCPKRGSFSNVLFFHIVPFHYFALIFENLNAKFKDLQ